MSEDIAYMSVRGNGLSDPANATDFPLTHVENKDCSVTETWWWPVHFPDRDLNLEIYFWKHPNLNTMSGGMWAYQGIKRHHLQSEHFNFRSHAPAPTIEGNVFKSPPEIGLTITIVEPMEKQEVVYEAPDGSASLRFTATSLMPPALRANNAHFEQAQRILGTLVLNGEEIPIDCVAVRDRSWGEPRPEVSVKHPPTLWGVGATEDAGTVFNFNGTDDPDHDPVTASYGLARADTLKAGWIWRDGAFRTFTAISKKTVRAADGLQALSYDITLTDDQGETYHLTGRIKAAVFWSPWPNMAAFFGQLAEWELDGVKMYGEAQEVFWGDCLQKMIR